MDLSLDYSVQELTVIDIQFLGLVKTEWEIKRGSRDYRLYKYSDGTTAVKDSYAYTHTADGRTMVDLSRKLEWFDASGVKFLEKDISQEVGIKKLKILNREIRQGRIDYLEGSAEELAAAAPYLPEPFKSDFEKASENIEIIMKYYETEINHYVQRGSLEFEEALLNETSTAMLALLSLWVRPPDSLFSEGLDIREAIIFQLNAHYDRGEYNG